MYFTTTVSVALVLFLVGLECLVLLSAHELMRHIKENVVLSIVLKVDNTSDEVERTKRMLKAAPYCLDYRFISREDALREHINNLGEDPTSFLGYNPLTDAFEVRLQAAYAQFDSIESIEKRLLNLPYVDKVIYQRDVVKVLNNNLNEIFVVLFAVALALLMIALVLISNTIQLQVYSKRFLINTMRLVGATPWVIKWPFIGRNIRMGIEAGLVALLMLAATYYYCQTRLGVMLFPLIWQNVVFVSVIVLTTGVIITFLASLIATSRYIRMKISKMYEI
ncbi:MAG: permease-like cell division protein FtsX [Paludibacteraceae bacterium]|nr:permease-like cell division protein FtsX [Paludibacteraceae bacterium]